MDFLRTQMGVTEENLNDRLFVFSGDGKTFDVLQRLKKYLSTHKGKYESLQCVVPMLELWHTKWTDLSRVVRCHFGKDSPNDPSTLAAAAKKAECPTPNDLRKVDFYQGAHLVNLALDANLLNCWE